MGFFANIPKPPKLAGFFGSEEEGEKSDGANTTTNAANNYNDDNNYRFDVRFYGFLRACNNASLDHAEIHQ